MNFQIQIFKHFDFILNFKLKIVDFSLIILVTFISQAVKITKKQDFSQNNRFIVLLLIQQAKLNIFCLANMKSEYKI